MIDTLASADLVEARLRSIAAGILHMQGREEAITLESNLFALGLESLSVVELLTQIEEEFGVIVDVEDLGDDVFENFAGLVRFVKMLQARG